MTEGIKTNEYEKERARLNAIFAGSDEKAFGVLDGLIDEAAKCRVELRHLSRKRDDLLMQGAPFSVTVQIDNLIVKIRASYTNITDKLCRWLVAKDTEIIDDELDDYE